VVNACWTRYASRALRRRGRLLIDTPIAYFISAGEPPAVLRLPTAAPAAPAEKTARTTTKALRETLMPFSFEPEARGPA
jgi:hypothetical protein